MTRAPACRTLAWAGLLLLAAGPAAARAVSAPPPERIVLRILDTAGDPIAGANVLALEGAATYLRQALVRADSNGVAVAEIGPDAYLNLRVMADGFETWKVELAPGAPDRKKKVIEVRLQRVARGETVPIEL